MLYYINIISSSSPRTTHNNYVIYVEWTMRLRLTYKNKLYVHLICVTHPIVRIDYSFWMATSGGTSSQRRLRREKTRFWWKKPEWYARENRETKKTDRTRKCRVRGVPTRKYQKQMTFLTGKRATLLTIVSFRLFGEFRFVHVFFSFRHDGCCVCRANRSMKMTGCCVACGVDADTADALS